jgi:hypothetical protein
MNKPTITGLPIEMLQEVIELALPQSPRLVSFERRPNADYPVVPTSPTLPVLQMAEIARDWMIDRRRFLNIQHSQDHNLNLFIYFNFDRDILYLNLSFDDILPPSQSKSMSLQLLLKSMPSQLSRVRNLAINFHPGWSRFDPSPEFADELRKFEILRSLKIRIVTEGDSSQVMDVVNSILNDQGFSNGPNDSDIVDEAKEWWRTMKMYGGFGGIKVYLEWFCPIAS